MAALRWLRTYWGGLLLGLFGLYWLWASRAGDRLHQRAHYTIGYLTGWRPTPKSGTYYNFYFMVADSLYRGSSPSDAGMATATGSRFVVKYDSLNPDSNVGYFKVTIPDSIRKAPPTGWRVPPFPIPQQLLDRGKQRKP
jgi:hypothetical protein